MAKITSDNLEEKIAEIVEEGMWTVESQQSNLDYTIPKLLDLFTSYANEVANKARIASKKTILSYLEDGMNSNGTVVLPKVENMSEGYRLAYGDFITLVESEINLDQLRTKTGEDK